MIEVILTENEARAVLANMEFAGDVVEALGISRPTVLPTPRETAIAKIQLELHRGIAAEGARCN